MAYSQFATKSAEERAKLVSVLAYITVIGWVVAFYLYGQQKCQLVRFHLRQSLGLILTAAVLSFIPLIGWSLISVLFLMWLFCIYQAYLGHSYYFPFLGVFYQEYLDFVA